MQHKRTGKKLSQQVKAHVSQPPDKVDRFDTDVPIVSTGCTLLDLAISGGRFNEGGIPGGILAEIFGPAGCGKTMLLCEIAGDVRRRGGQVMFRDPEARINKQFARLFGLDIDDKKVDYDMPSTVPEVFEPVRKWKLKDDSLVNGAFADSLTALTTQWEEEGKDQYGMRRAKEFSEQCRLTCRHVTEGNILMMFSNQVRVNIDAGTYGQKFSTPGGMAIGFYCSLRLRCSSPRRIKKIVRVAGKELTKTIGMETDVEVYKNSVWEPYHTAKVFLLYEYGIDDVRGNLTYLKTMTASTTYTIDGRTSLGQSVEKAIRRVEKDDLVDKLRDKVISLWHEVEEKFRTARKPKRRFMED